MSSAYNEGPVLPKILCFPAPNIDCLRVEPDSKRAMAEQYVSPFKLNDAASSLILGAGLLSSVLIFAVFDSPRYLFIVNLCSVLKWNHGEAK
jgi:hypothetical protein